MTKIRFNQQIYQKELIKQTVEQFKNLADIKLTESGDYLDVEFTNIDSEVANILPDEFANYALGLHG